MTSKQESSAVPILLIGKNENPKLECATFEFVPPVTQQNIPNPNGGNRLSLISVHRNI